MTCDETFDLLTRRDPDAETKKKIEAHLAGCEECRTMKEALAAYDDAFAHPERAKGDPPHVQKAILEMAHRKAAEFRREIEGGEQGGAPTLRVLPSRAPRLRAPPSPLLIAAAVLLLLGAGFVVGRLTAPVRVLLPEGPTVHVDPRGVDPVVTPR